MARAVFYVVLLLLLIDKDQSHSLISSELVSSGIDDVHQFALLLLKGSNPSTECEPMYGFVPCSYQFESLLQVVAYEYLLLKGEKYVTVGSESLFKNLGPGYFSRNVFRILRALPEAIILLASGLSVNKESVQSKVMVGMGILAGSTILLLTILWGSFVVVGKCDFKDSTAVDLTDTTGLSLFGCGISTDNETRHAARIMAISVIPFIIVQVPYFFHSFSGRSLAVLISLIVCVGFLLSYSIYQIFQPWIQTRCLSYVVRKHVISGILKWSALGRLLTDDGDPNVDVIKQLFKRIDLDGDAQLSESELRAVVIGIRSEEMDLDEDDVVQKVLKYFDTSGNHYVSEEEFVKGISKWLMEPQRSLNGVRDSGPTFLKAVLFLLLGIGIAALFADPLVDAIDNFSSAMSIPSFFTSFITLPLATNLNKIVLALKIVSGKKKINVSEALCEQIYGAVFMNNTLGLATFLTLVYAQGLTWAFSAQVLVVIIVCIVMGLLTSFPIKFPLWTSFVAFLLYPLSLVLVYVLTNNFGWS